MEQLTLLYKEYAGVLPAGCQPITGSGSNRQYYRLTDTLGRSVIGVVGTSREENQAFLYLTHHFERKGLPVPHILAQSADEMRYLQSDLGDRSLYDALKKGRQNGQYSEAERELIPPHRGPLAPCADAGRRGTRLRPFAIPKGTDGPHQRDVRPQLLQVLFPPAQCGVIP